MLLGVVGAQEPGQDRFEDLLPSFEAQVGAAADEGHGQQPGCQPAEHERHRQDDEDLVAQRVERDAPPKGKATITALRADAISPLRN